VKILSFTLNYDTDRGRCRLLIHDTTDGVLGTDYVFEDAAIDAALSLNSDSVWLASSDLCRSLAAKTTDASFSFKIPGAIELDKRQIAKLYLSLAKEYYSRASGSADMVAEYIDSFDLNISDYGVDAGEYVGDN